MVNLKGFSRVTMAMDLVASLFIRSNVRIFVVENSSLGHAYRKCESYPIRVGGGVVLLGSEVCTSKLGIGSGCS
jgi:hypothetical protein